MVKDLGVYHNGYAAAKDEKGWFHVDKKGSAIYDERYAFIEPFYNDVAYALTLEGEKVWVNYYTI